MICFAVVQKLTTSWNKDSRGKEGAAKRNSTPSELRIPLTSRPAEGKLLLHQVTYSSWQSSDFDKPLESFELLEPKRPFRIGSVTVEFVPTGLHVIYCYTPEDVGAPYRTDFPREFDLKPKEWLQIVHNGRFSNEGFWYYDKTVINVGLFEQLDAEVFLHSQPKKAFSDVKILR